MTRNGRKITEVFAIRFSSWCEENGVSLDNEEDWGPWWDCWVDGGSAFVVIGSDDDTARIYE